MIKVYIKPNTYSSYDPTILNFDAIDGEPDAPEYQVPVENKNMNAIIRVESSRNLVVKSIVFVNLRFLEEESINFKQALEIFA